MTIGALMSHPRLKLVGDPDYTVPVRIPPKRWKLELGCAAIWVGLAVFWGLVAWAVVEIFNRS